MLCADPVMDTDQPRLEISENEMDNGQELLGHFEIATFGNGVVIVAAFPQAGATAPIVRDDQRPRSDGAIDKSTKRFGATVSGNCTSFSRSSRVSHISVHSSPSGESVQSDNSSIKGLFTKTLSSGCSLRRLPMRWVLKQVWAFEASFVFTRLRLPRI